MPPASTGGVRGIVRQIAYGMRDLCHRSGAHPPLAFAPSFAQNIALQTIIDAPMPILAADIRRCCTCQRWAGPRWVGVKAGSVCFEHAAVHGLCTDGPWHGSPRSLRNACGRWVQWLALLPSVQEQGRGR